MRNDEPRRDLRPPTTDADEKATLLAFLRYVRAGVPAKARGMSAVQAGTPGVPSGTSLLGLLRHLTVGEYYWFEWVYLGIDGPMPDFGMDVAPGETAEELIAGYEAACHRSDAIIESCADLDRHSARAVRGGTRSLRWILLHLIEETARHAGHADILREQIDGAVGR